MLINPQELFGSWKAGWALDLHTTSSTQYKSEDGTSTYDYVRPPIAEELYKLKYWKEINRVDLIARTASEFLVRHNAIWKVDEIIPVPPSDNTRKFQPVYELAKAIGYKSGISVNIDILKKVKSTSELKDIKDPDIRREILKDAFNMEVNSLLDKEILIFDDLYRSGETLNTVCSVIMNVGKAKCVYVLTITKTRTKR